MNDLSHARIFQCLGLRNKSSVYREIQGFDNSGRQERRPSIGFILVRGIKHLLTSGGFGISSGLAVGRPTDVRHGGSPGHF